MDPGTVVANRFEIEQLAGQGGMGAVYRAKDRLTGEAVALKTLLETAASAGERFEREATLLADLRHPGIVRYVAHGALPSGELWLAMEWLEGGDLHARLAEGGLTVDESIALVGRAADALAVAHARGIVHRDIKPANLFLPAGRVDRVKLLDFGVARLGPRATEATRTGMLLGTPSYMAPEQARGAKDVGVRADVFALGCVLFECVAGHRPFEGTDPLAVLAKVLFEEAPRLSEVRRDVPPALDGLVARMLSKDPAERPADAAEVARALSALGEVGGAAIAPTARRAPQAVTAAEQRVVSVVLVGAGQPIDEALAATVAVTDAPARARVEAAARPFGARIEVLVDGTILCALASHATATDQVVQASRAALAIRASVPELPVVLATGRGSFAGHLALGEVIDRAVVLLRGPLAAIEDAVVLDEVTAGLLDPRFVVEVRPEGRLLRGEREPTEIGRSVLGKPTPCVGRERELSALDALLSECVSESVARTMLVTAAAGVGKSRLRAEFLRRVAAREEPVEVWTSRGDPIRAGSPFGLIAAALRRIAGVLEGEPLPARQQKLRARVAAHVSPDEAARVTEFVSELAGAPVDEPSVQLRAARENPILMGDQLRRAFVDLLDAETRERPLLLVLEDLHWGDLPSIQLVDAALRTLSDRPLMVLAFARPEVHEQFPDAWRERGVQELRLSELTRKASERLVRAVLGATVSDATVARVVEHAQGNAFFLEELIRAVAEGKGESFPDTVLTIVQSRLERLHPDARRVMRAASIFGMTFWVDGLLALLGDDFDAAQLDPWLVELDRRELVIARGEGKFQAEIELRFRHNLLREASYGTLTEGDRQRGHQLAAEWLSAMGEADALVLAEHFEKSKTPNRAVGWYRTAAEQALEGNDLGGVIARATQGIACGAEGATLGALRALQAEAHGWRGDSALAIERAEQALPLLTTGSAEWCNVIGRLCELSYRAGMRDRLVELVDLLRDVSAGPGAGRHHVATMARVAIPLLIGGLYELAELLFGQIMRVEAAVPGDEASSGVKHSARAFRAVFLTRELERGLHLFDDSAKSYALAGDVRNGGRARVLAACVRVQLGDYAVATEVFRGAIVEAARAGLPAQRALSESYLGTALSRQGMAEEALVVGERAVLACDALQDRLMGVPARCHLALTHLGAGRGEAALGAAQEAVALATGTPRLRGRALATLATVLEASGQFAEALPPAREAYELLGKLRGFGEGDALCRLAYADALRGTGDGAGARDALVAAAKEILQIAAGIEDEGLRRAFVEAVPENARTLDLAQRPI